MTARPETDVIDYSVEPLLEELLKEVVTGIRTEPRGHNGESITTALAEVAMASFSRAVSQASAVERALLVDALAPALAEALAPALAKVLAPEIVTALSHLATAPEPAAEPDYAESEPEDFEPDDSEPEEPVGEDPPTEDTGPGKGRKSRG